MGKLKDDSNFQIYGWMVSKLNLKGNELLIYAIIYSFSRNNNGEGVFNASTSYLCEWTNSSQRNVINCLSSLIKKNLITKLEDNSSKKKPNIYKINENVFQQTTEQSSVNNNIINTKDNNIINNIVVVEEQKKIEEKEILKTYAEINPRFTSLEIELLKDDMKRYPTKWIIAAMKKAVSQGIYKLSYIEGILNNWDKNGFETGDKNRSSKEKGMVRQRKSSGYKGLYKSNKVETIADAERKFANETSGWD